MIESDFVECCTTGKRADVSTDTTTNQSTVTIGSLVGTHHHRHRIPTNDTFNAAFGFSIAGIGRLLFDWNRIDVGCRGLDGDFNPFLASTILKSLY